MVYDTWPKSFELDISKATKLRPEKIFSTSCCKLLLLYYVCSRVVNCIDCICAALSKPYLFGSLYKSSFVISCIRFQLSKFFDPVTTRPPSYQMYRLYLCGVFETLLIHLHYVSESFLPRRNLVNSEAGRRSGPTPPKELSKAVR